jgi:hypothetical protein
MRQRCGGFAVLELACWSAVLLPITLFSASIFSQIYDHAVMTMLPETLLRETQGHVVTWRPDGAEGGLEVVQERQRELVKELAERAMTEISSSTFKLSQHSALACSWEVSITADTGFGRISEGAVCVSQGPLSAQLSLDQLLHVRLQEPIAVPLGVPGVAARYADTRVLVGVVLAGVFNGLMPGVQGDIVTAQAVGGLREEVML